MWARVVEFMLACWLAISPFVFQAAADEPLPWAVTWTAACLVGSCALLSYWNRTRRAHLLTLLLALALVGYGRFGEPAPVPPLLQNLTVVGLLLLMFALVPNRASKPPAGWRKLQLGTTGQGHRADASR